MMNTMEKTDWLTLKGRKENRRLQPCAEKRSCYAAWERSTRDTEKEKIDPIGADYLYRKSGACGLMKISFFFKNN